jgi:hypothetical protein
MIDPKRGLQSLPRAIGPIERSRLETPVDRDRVRELAGHPSGQGRDVVPSMAKRRGCATVRGLLKTEPTGSEPWYGSCSMLLAIAEAPSIEEVRRLKPGFGRAYREAWHHCWKNKQSPRKYRSVDKDEALFQAMMTICIAFQDNPVMRDPAASDVSRKLAKLFDLALIRRHEQPPGGNENVE